MRNAPVFVEIRCGVWTPETMRVSHQEREGKDESRNQRRDLPTERMHARGGILRGPDIEHGGGLRARLFV